MENALLDAILSSLRNRLLPKKRRFVILDKPSYVRRHEGRDFLVVATGPSIRTHREEIRRFIWPRDLIIIAVNYIGDLCLPCYHLIVNRSKLCRFGKDISPLSIPLVSPWLPTRIVGAALDGRTYERIMYRGTYPNTGNTGSLQLKANGIFKIEGETAATVAVGVALSMGAKNIYCVGMDGFSPFVGREDDIHFYYDADRIPFERRLSLERATHGILKDCAKILSERGGTLKVITPTAYEEFYDATIL